ncbi:hypothetical protein DAETH_35180 (plasmid) [Deinococcus aetherius]|uniref:Uncharacterized protein n=1 Tax=Deinococcus aetherius TaxID=200252 RepID=A0ABM8AIB8_9DEIO|nr:hypothetical protein DAETH_35180 [Deinococcus aetherius]
MPKSQPLLRRGHDGDKTVAVGEGVSALSQSAQTVLQDASQIGVQPGKRAICDGVTWGPLEADATVRRAA